MIDSYNDQKFPETRAQADEILANPAANAYDKSLAAQLASQAAYQLDDVAAAKKYLLQVLEFNGLDNNGHFQAMLMLAQLQLQDGSEDYRTAAGDLKTAMGSTSDKLSINLAHLTPMDRARLMRILRENSKGKSMLFSLFPENPDPLLEQDHMLYGKASNIDAVATPYYETYSAPLQIEGI